MPKCSSTTWLFLAGALALGCGKPGPSTGVCQGSIGSLVVADMAIDERSQFHRIRKTTCAEVDRGIYDFSFGGGALVIHAETPAANIGGVVAFTHATYPLPPTSQTTPVKEWSLLSPSAPPELSRGTLTLDGAVSRKAGSFTMEFSDQSAVTCSFDLVHGDAVGEMIRCGSGDGDFDD